MACTCETRDIADPCAVHGYTDAGQLEPGPLRDWLEALPRWVKFHSEVAMGIGEVGAGHQLDDDGVLGGELAAWLQARPAPPALAISANHVELGDVHGTIVEAHLEEAPGTGDATLTLQLDGGCVLEVGAHDDTVFLRWRVRPSEP
jgi:hypothetical protein